MLASVVPAFRGDELKPREVWDAPPFSVDPSKLAEAANRQVIPPESSFVILLQEKECRYESDGRRSWRYHQIVKVLQPSAIGMWSTIESEWAPWNTAHPELRARVINGDGKVRELDPATVAEASAGPSSGDTYSDRRKIRAALPAVEVGSIIEKLITYRETQRFFEAGAAEWTYFGAYAPVLQSRLTVSLPAGMPFSRRIHDLPDVKIQKREESGRTEWTFDQGRLEPILAPEPHRPSDIPPQANIAFSTAASWNDVARTYAKTVDEAVGDSHLKSLVESIVKDASGRVEISNRLYQWLSRNIRYTGIEFGKSAIIPHAPADTLARKFGDCKDKAELLIAMLREAGISARIALLNADAVMDVENELPGIENFDHAIVVLPGSPHIWIDPTDEFGRAGELPTSDQGRRSLIISPDTSALTTTPFAPPGSNADTVNFEIRLGSQGKATVAYTEEARGYLEEFYRATFRDSAPEKIRERISDNTKKQLAAEKVDSLESTKPDDLSGHFQVRMVVEGVARGNTEDFSAAAALPIGGVLGNLPEELREEDADKTANTSDEKESGTGRRYPFVVKSPSVTTFEFHVVPPVGFVPVSLPPGKDEMIGTAHLTESYERQPDNSVNATFRLDATQRTLSVDEFHRTRKDSEKFASRTLPLLSFRLEASQKFAAGDLVGAIQDLRIIEAKNPGDAMTKARLAQALAEAGAGAAARRKAAEAAKLEPKSAVIQRALGRVLARDELGRIYHRGFDRSGAISAYRRSIELDPGADDARGELAIILENNDRGERYATDADLPSAISLYEELADSRKAHGLDDNLFIDLFRLGRYEQLARRLDRLDRTTFRDAYRIAGRAAEKGPTEAISASWSLSPDPDRHRELMTSAAQLLLIQRRYPETAALLREAARGAADSDAVLTLASVTSRTVRHETVRLSGEDPTTPVRRLLQAVVQRDSGSKARSIATFTESTRKYLNDDNGRNWLEHSTASLGSLSAQSDTSADVLADMMASTIEWSTEAGPAGSARVLCRIPDADVKLAFFVRKEGGEYRIVTSGDQPDLLGVEALRCLRGNAIDEARKWLDWAREDLTPPGGDDPLSGSAFPSLWSRGEKGDSARVEIAAAALAADGPGASLAIPVLEKAHAGETSDAKKTALAHALLGAYVNSRQFDLLFPFSEKLSRQFPRSQSAFEIHSLAAVRTNHLKDGISFARERAREFPDESVFVRGLSEMLAQAGEFEESRRLGQSLIESGKATPMDYNNLAWSSLAGRVTDADLELARKATTMTSRKNPASLNTLAALDAARGLCLEARNTELEAMSLMGKTEPAYMDWYVFGRILEDYGETGDALATYDKIHDEAAPTGANSVSALAGRRVLLLRGSPDAKR